MKQHYKAAFVAASALISLAPHAAQARHHSHHRHVTPARWHAQPTARPARAFTSVSSLGAPVESVAWVGQTGAASYYGPGYNHKRSASGRMFDQADLTAAHPWLPFGTKVKVTRADTGRSVVVTITDRLYSSRRVVDLSLAAAAELGMIQRGVATVTLDPTT